jgi:hypothetical protein
VTRDLSALRPAVALSLITALALATLLLLGSAGLASLFVPGPADAAAELLRALAAHREPAAHRELSEAMRAQVPPERLQALASALAARLGPIDQVDAAVVDERDDRATVRATLRAGAGEEHQVDLPLVKEEGLWHVASVEPLRQLAQ